MLRVGLTGGAAAGKSAVAAAFSRLGVPVLSADAAAHRLTADGAPLLTHIHALFGDGVFTDDGALDRRALAGRVFADADARAALEALLHPPIRAALADELRAVDGPYAVIEIPLLAPEDRGVLVDRVLAVEAPESLRLERLARRPGIDSSTAKAIVAAQRTDAERAAFADDRLMNTGTLDDLEAEVAALDARYRALAGVCLRPAGPTE